MSNLPEAISQSHEQVALEWSDGIIDAPFATNLEAMTFANGVYKSDDELGRPHTPFKIMKRTVTTSSTEWVEVGGGGSS